MDYANYLTAMGRFDESIEIGKQAVAIDPLSPVAYNELGWALRNAGRDEAALEQYRKGLELNPDFPQSHWALSDLYLKKGMYNEAAAESQKHMSLVSQNDDSLAFVGYTFGRTGRRAEALAILNEWKKRAKNQEVSAASLAVIYIGLGQREPALDLLERAYQGRDVRLVWLKVASYYDPLRGDPRFQDLLRRMNFPP